ncbi:MAG: hypothetical protein WC460_00215 [Patescibacteria group bacterium]
MKKLLLIIPVLALLIFLSACNLKVNLNSNLNQSTVKIEPNANQNANENVNQNINVAPIVNTEYVVTANPEKMVTEIKSGEVTLKDFKALCGNEVMVYAEPKNGFIIFQAFNPGSDKPISSLYLLDLSSKGCKKLDVSKELSDFGALILSPDQTKLAVALETNEAKELKVLDLINDTAKALVTLPEGETLNGGYGALSNHFDIKWLDDKTIQYTVYEDTVKNYAKEASEKIEKVLQVRVVKVE